MNIEIANRLLEYRKQMGLSQEELAEKIGISRQSVSKWERAEASPDTDNLIELAKIYNVTLDELLNGKAEEPKEIEEVKETATPKDNTKDSVQIQIGKLHVNINGTMCEETDDDNHVFINKDNIKYQNHLTKEEEIISWDNVYTKDENGERVPIKDVNKIIKNKNIPLKKKRIKDAINSILILLITALYVTLCALFMKKYRELGTPDSERIFVWSKFWVIFIAYPALSSLVDAIFKKRAKEFAYPVFLAFVYAVLGIYFGLWHPYWCIFVTIPLYYVIVNACERKHDLYFEDKYGKEHSFVYKDHDYEFEYVSKKTDK